MAFVIEQIAIQKFLIFGTGSIQQQGALQAISPTTNTSSKSPEKKTMKKMMMKMMLMMTTTTTTIWCQ
jgi:hypothetical protein